MTIATAIREIALDNDEDFAYTLTKPDRTAATGNVPATGLSGLAGRLSLTEGGATIHSSLTVNATEVTGKGIYYGTFLGAYLRAHCADLVGELCFIVFGDGSHVYTNEPVRIVATRRPG